MADVSILDAGFTCLPRFHRLRPCAGFMANECMIIPASDQGLISARYPDIDDSIAIWRAVPHFSVSYAHVVVLHWSLKCTLFVLIVLSLTTTSKFSFLANKGDVNFTLTLGWRPFTRNSVCLVRPGKDALSHQLHVCRLLRFGTLHTSPISTRHALMILHHMWSHPREYDNDTHIF